MLVYRTPSRFSTLGADSEIRTVSVRVRLGAPILLRERHSVTGSGGSECHRLSQLPANSFLATDVGFLARALRSLRNVLRIDGANVYSLQSGSPPTCALLAKENSDACTGDRRRPLL